MRRVRSSRFDQTKVQFKQATPHAPRWPAAVVVQPTLLTHFCNACNAAAVTASGIELKPLKNDQSIRPPPFKVLTAAGQPN